MKTATLVTCKRYECDPDSQGPDDFLDWFVETEDWELAEKIVNDRLQARDRNIWWVRGSVCVQADSYRDSYNLITEEMVKKYQKGQSAHPSLLRLKGCRYRE